MHAEVEVGGVGAERLNRDRETWRDVVAIVGLRLTEGFRRAFVNFGGTTDLARCAIASPGRSYEPVSRSVGL